MNRRLHARNNTRRAPRAPTPRFVDLVLVAALMLLAIVPAEAREAAAGIEVLLDTTNAAAVRNGTSRPSVLKLAAPRLITLIQTYHWNGGRGASAGWISLRGQDGKQYGPWRATPGAGQGGAPSAFWTCSPSTVLPAGTYTVVVSDPATWSSNAESIGAEATPEAGVGTNARAVGHRSRRRAGARRRACVPRCGGAQLR